MSSEFGVNDNFVLTFDSKGGYKSKNIVLGADFHPMVTKPTTLVFKGTNKRFSGVDLALSLGLDTKRVNKLIYLHNRTKRSRIKNKINKMLLAEINKEIEGKLRVRDIWG